MEISLQEVRTYNNQTYVTVQLKNDTNTTIFHLQSFGQPQQIPESFIELEKRTQLRAQFLAAMLNPEGYFDNLGDDVIKKAVAYADRLTDAVLK